MTKRKNGEVRLDPVNASRPSKRSKLKHPANHEAGQNKQKKNQKRLSTELEQVEHKGHKKNKGSRRKEQKAKDSKALEPVQHDSVVVEIGRADEKKVKPKEKGGRKKPHKPESLNETDSWEMSGSAGGCMLDLDPIFSPDEE